VGLVPFHRNGAAADFVAVPTGCLVPRPRSLLHVPAAALSLAGLTAWQAVVDRAGVTPADEVLVLGGTGGVGTFAVQIAAARGARVTATHRGEGRSFLTDLGAESTVDLAAAQLGEAGGRFDVVIDTVGAEVAVRSVALLRDGGRLVTLTAPLPAGPADEARRRGVQAVFFLVSADAGELALLARSAAVGDLRIPIAQTFPLEDGAHAFRRGGSGCRRPGKVVLVVRD
jgi:NADPH:quinone reductase-like Zn-dependent oxidoreductase